MIYHRLAALYSGRRNGSEIVLSEPIRIRTVDSLTASAITKFACLIACVKTRLRIDKDKLFNKLTLKRDSSWLQRAGTVNCIHEYAL